MRTKDVRLLENSPQIYVVLSTLEIDKIGACLHCQIFWADMVIESSSDLIRSWHTVILADGRSAAEAELINGNALVISDDGIALFRKPNDCVNPLSGGLIRHAAFPANLPVPVSPFIERHRAGFVGLTGGLALLIGLNELRMYSNPEDALRNRDILLELSLAPS